MSFTELADWVTLIVWVAALWILAFDLWNRTFTWNRLAIALSTFITVKALFWTWALALREWPGLRPDYLLWCWRTVMITVGAWVIVEVRRLPKQEGRLHRLWRHLVTRLRA